MSITNNMDGQMFMEYLHPYYSPHVPNRSNTMFAWYSCQLLLLARETLLTHIHNTLVLPRSNNLILSISIKSCNILSCLILDLFQCFCSCRSQRIYNFLNLLFNIDNLLHNLISNVLRVINDWCIMTFLLTLKSFTHIVKHNITMCYP